MGAAAEAQGRGVVEACRPVGRGDAKLRLVRHQVKRGVRDMDRAVIGLHPPLVRRPVRQRRDSMCWKDPDEKYNDGGAFKLTCRDESGVVLYYS